VSWNYTGRPESSTRDEVRFLVGDTCEKNPLVRDEEIAYALAKFPTVRLAAALVLRALASKFASQVSYRVGDVQLSGGGQVTGAYQKRADELDPSHLTAGCALLLPKFGGESISEKETFDADSDAVQPAFRRGMNDIPGGPGDVSTEDYDDDRIR